MLEQHSFQEVMRQWRRMCADGSIGYACAECKMYASIDESICRGIPSEDDAKNIERFVMEWAAEHPEPVYETWGQYFRRYYGFEYCVGHEMLLEHIPAVIAQKLGIEPKEGA